MVTAMLGLQLALAVGYVPGLNTLEPRVFALASVLPATPRRLAGPPSNFSVPW